MADDKKTTETNPDSLEPRGVVDGKDFRAGAGGAIDESAGSPGGTLGTGGAREQDR